MDSEVTSYTDIRASRIRFLFFDTVLSPPWMMACRGLGVTEREMLAVSETTGGRVVKVVVRERMYREEGERREEGRWSTGPEKGTRERLTGEKVPLLSSVSCESSQR